MPPGKAWKEAFYAMRDEEDKTALALVSSVLSSNRSEASSATCSHRDGGQQNGWTLLHQAASLHQLQCLDALLKAIKPEAIDDTTHAGQSASGGDRSGYSVLPPNPKNPNPPTPQPPNPPPLTLSAALHLAAQRDDVDACEMLVLAGADMEKGSACGYPPWRQAQRHRADAAEQYLRRAQDNKSKFGRWERRGCVGCVGCGGRVWVGGGRGGGGAEGGAGGQGRAGSRGG